MSRKTPAHTGTKATSKRVVEPESDSESGSYSYDSGSYSGSEEESPPAPAPSSRNGNNKAAAPQRVTVKVNNKGPAPPVNKASSILDMMNEEPVARGANDNTDDTSEHSDDVKEVRATSATSKAGGRSSTNNNISTSTMNVRSRKQEPQQQDDGYYAVGFIHVLGERKEEIRMKVFPTNNLGAARKNWDQGNEKGLKTHKAILCTNGDALNIIAAWNKQYSHKLVPRTKDWYLVSKQAVDEFVDLICRNPDYSSVTEAKAKKP